MELNLHYVFYAFGVAYYIFSIIFYIVLYRKISKENTKVSASLKSTMDETIATVVKITKAFGVTKISDILNMIDKTKDKDTLNSDDITSVILSIIDNLKDTDKEDTDISNSVDEKPHKNK